MINSDTLTFAPGSILVATGLVTAGCAKRVVAVYNEGRGG